MQIADPHIGHDSSHEFVLNSSILRRFLLPPAIENRAEPRRRRARRNHERGGATCFSDGRNCPLWLRATTHTAAQASRPASLGLWLLPPQGPITSGESASTARSGGPSKKPGTVPAGTRYPPDKTHVRRRTVSGSRAMWNPVNHHDAQRVLLHKSLHPKSQAAHDPAVLEPCGRPSSPSLLAPVHTDQDRAHEPIRRRS